MKKINFYLLLAGLMAVSFFSSCGDKGKCGSTSIESVQGLPDQDLESNVLICVKGGCNKSNDELMEIVGNYKCAAQGDNKKTCEGGTDCADGKYCNASHDPGNDMGFEIIRVEPGNTKCADGETSCKIFSRITKGGRIGCRCKCR